MKSVRARQDAAFAVEPAGKVLKQGNFSKLSALVDSF